VGGGERHQKRKREQFLRFNLKKRKKRSRRERNQFESKRGPAAGRGSLKNYTIELKVELEHKGEKMHKEKKILGINQEKLTAA